MIFLDMYSQVQSALGLEDITGFDEKTYAKGLVNRGSIDVLSRTRCTVRCLQIGVLADVGQYVLGQTVLALVDIEDGDNERVARSSSRCPSFTLIRSDVLRVQPTPSEDGLMQVWAVVHPQPMVDDEDSPSMEAFGAIPDEYQDAIVLYAMWKAADYADDASSNQGERYRALYEGEDGRGGRLGQIRMLVNKRGTARAPRRRVRLRPVPSSSNWIG